MCEASYVVRRDKCTILATLHYVQSYDKVARSTIEAMKRFLDLLIELWTNANRTQLELRLEQLTWSSSQESQLFKTVPHAMRHDIMRDLALATKLVILWTGISVYTSIPVKRVTAAIPTPTNHTAPRVLKTHQLCTRRNNPGTVPPIRLPGYLPCSILPCPSSQRMSP